jgi:protein arginine N-methyltransferase 7
MGDGDIERMIATFEAALEGRDDYAWALLGVAETVAAKKHPVQAAELARRAIAAAPGDPAVTMRARRLLGSLLPGYHVPMMNDARRNPAWDSALRRAIRPGMLALEIGTGAGMLAMMAARAGARVVTCETNAVAAAMARELAALNGLSEAIQVVDGHSRDLAVGGELDRPADLLLCDIFADGLLDFDPLTAIFDARERLLAPGAPAIPGAASLRAALARWEDWPRMARVERACGFDIAPFAGFVPAAIAAPIGAPGLALLSGDGEAFRFDFEGPRPPGSERRAFTVTAERGGEANAIVRWIRLELDERTRLEARPEPGAAFFSGLTIAALPAPLALREGESLTLGAYHDGRRIDTWVEAPGRARP